MPNQIASVKSDQSVLYRHTHMGETKFASTGEILPESSAGPGIWEAYTDDNGYLGEGSIEVLVGKGLIHVATFIHIPEVGNLINLKYGRSNLPDGQYRITRVKCGKENFHIQVERIGEIISSELIHVLKLASC